MIASQQLTDHSKYLPIKESWLTENPRTGDRLKIAVPYFDAERAGVDILLAQSSGYLFDQFPENSFELFDVLQRLIKSFFIAYRMLVMLVPIASNRQIQEAVGELPLLQ